MRILKHVLAIVVSSILSLQVCSTAQAANADGKWYYDNTQDDRWWNENNWVNRYIPNGANRTAELIGNEHYQAFIEIHSNDPAITLGGLYFSGSTYFSFCNWGSLTLRSTSGQPFIYTHADAEIGGSRSLEGTNGFVKKGSGFLFLGGNGQHSLSGNILVQEGTLASSEPDTWDDDISITVNAGARYQIAGDSADQFGSISGSGTLDLYVSRDSSSSWIKVGADNSSKEFSGLIKGEGSLGKTGTGTMTISGANTFTGKTWVEQGTLSLTNSNALGKSTVELSSGFDLNGLNHTFGGIAGSANFAMASNSVLTVGTNNKDTTYSGVLSGNDASLVKVGSGTLTLTGNNSFTGGTILKEGKLCVNRKSNLNLANSKLTIDGGILRTEGVGITSLNDDQIVWGASGGGFDVGVVLDLSANLSGNGKFVKQGDGELTLLGDNSGMTGDVHVQGGKVILNGSQNSIGDASLVTIDSGATLEFDWNQPSERIGGLSGGGTLYLGNDGELTVGDHRDTEFSGIIRGDIDDQWDISGKLIKVGSGRLTLSGESNRYNRGTEIREGTLSIGKESNLGMLEDNALIFNGGVLEITGTDLSSISRNITWGDGGAGFDIADASHTVSVSQAVTGNGGFTKRGAGTVVLSGNNTYKGETLVESGTLRLIGGNGSGTGRIEVFNGATLRAGINDSLAGYTHVQVNSGGLFVVEGGEDFGALSGAGNVNLNGYNIAFGFNDADTTFSGSISGNGIVKKYGDGLVTLSGANTCTNGLWVREGSLRLSGDNSGLVGTIEVYNAATLFAGQGNSLGANTHVQVQAGGLFDVDDHESFGGLSGAGAVNLHSYGLVVGFDDTDREFSGGISGSGYLGKAGSGTFTLSGNNQYSGYTRIQGGVLVAASDNALGTGTVYLDGGELVIADGVTISNRLDCTRYSGGAISGTGFIASSITLGNGSIVRPGNSPGILTVDGDFALDASSIIEIELGGLSRGDEYDALVITGNAVFHGTLDVSLFNGFSVNVGDAFDILDFASVSGEFSELILPELEEGVYWDTSRLYTTGEVSVTDVPEPGTMTLLALGGLALIRRRRSA